MDFALGETQQAVAAAAMRVGEENGGWRLITTQLSHERVKLGPADRIAPPYDRVRGWADRVGILGQPDVQRALAQTYASLRVNELLNWQIAAAGSVGARRRVGHEGLRLRAAAAAWPAARGACRAPRRPGRRRHRRAGSLARYSGQTEHRADLRRRRQRDPA